MIATAKAEPGKIAFSSPGNGTINHLAVEWLAIEAGLKLLHVPYRGGAPAAVAVINGEVQIGAVTPSSGMPHIQSGKAKIIAFMTKAAAVLHVGLADARRERPQYRCRALGRTVRARGHAAGDRLAAGFRGRENPRRRDVRTRLNAVGTEANPLSQAAFVERIRVDAERYLKIIQQTGVRVEH